jgi:hypothetical protein
MCNNPSQGETSMLWRALPCILIASVIAGCSGDDPAPPTTPAADTISPMVALVTSTDSVKTSGTLTLTATASDDATVAEIMFYEGSTLLAVKSRSPYAASTAQMEEKVFTHDIALTSSNNGDHSYHALVKDGGGNTSISDTIEVAVVIPRFPRSDNFDDGYTDPLQWSLSESGGTSIEETNGRIEIEVPSSASGSSFVASISSICNLTGDFDVQVDYELLEWPANAGVRMGLIAHNRSSGRCYFFNDFTQQDSFFADHNGSIQTAPATGTTGKLRITRVGNQWTSYYWDGATWQVTHTTSATVTSDHRVTLQAWGHDDRFGDKQVRVAFDNFVLNSGTPVDCD